MKPRAATRGCGAGMGLVEQRFAAISPGRHQATRLLEAAIKARQVPGGTRSVVTYPSAGGACSNTPFIKNSGATQRAVAVAMISVS